MWKLHLVFYQTPEKKVVCFPSLLLLILVFSSAESKLEMLNLYIIIHKRFSRVLVVLLQS